MITEKEETIALLKNQICQNCSFLIKETLIWLLEKNYKLLKRYVPMSDEKDLKPDKDMVVLEPPHCAIRNVKGYFTLKSEVIDLYGHCENFSTKFRLRDII